jgi:hypothetical protein
MSTPVVGSPKRLMVIRIVFTQVLEVGAQFRIWELVVVVMSSAGLIEIMFPNWS